MAVMVMEEDLEVVILEISLVMGRKRKIWWWRSWIWQPGWALDVAKPTVEVEIMEVEITMILEIITTNFLIMVQCRT